MPSLTSSPYVHLLNCTVCNGQYFSRQKWIEHLIQFGHQNLARKQNVSVVDTGAQRACSLVIFTTYDLTEKGARKVIQYFDRVDQLGTGITWVTDFVWWEDRPRLGIIQFESIKEANDILLEIKKNSGGDNDSIQIENQMIQVRGAGDLHDLEWKALLPGDNPFHLPVSSKNQQGPSKGTDRLPVQNYEHNQLIQRTDNSITAKNNWASSSLFEQLESVKKSILREHVPSIKLIVLRNWYLKLKNSGFTEIEREPFLIYVYSEDPVPGEGNLPDNFTWLPDHVLQSIIARFPGLISCPQKSFSELGHPNDNQLGCGLIFKSSGSNFQVLNLKGFIVEAQLCRLFKYLCEIDSRLSRILPLARYWIIVNELKFGDSQISQKLEHQCLPEPYPLDWMILTFFIHSKYLPSVRSILERPHRPIIEYETGADVGIDLDPEYSREWKKTHTVTQPSRGHYFLSILQIFQNFLEFCCTQIFDQGNVIINPKDGEILETVKVLNGNITSKLSSEEIEILQQHLPENSRNNSLSPYNWHMIHPLVTSWRFSTPSENMKSLIVTSTQKTNGRLKQLVKLIEDNGGEKAFKICGASLCEILKADREIPALDPVPCQLLKKRRMDSLGFPGNTDPPINKKIQRGK